MKGIFPINKFKSLQTPFYYYDTALLRDTLRIVNEQLTKHDKFMMHYAMKANANPKIMSIIAQAGFGVDCVSGWEIQAALKAGFPASKVVYAGVGKSDWEIEFGLDNDIFCFNVESIPELEIIDELAGKKGKKANIAYDMFCSIVRRYFCLQSSCWR